MESMKQATPPKAVETYEEEIKAPEPVPEKPAADVMCGSHLKTADELTGFPVFPEGQQNSMLCKLLSRDIWEANKNKVDKFGFSFKSAIFSGCVNVDSGIGIYAGSSDSYDEFSDLFHPLIEGYHKIDLQSGHVSDMDASKLNCPPFPADEAAMIKSTRIRVGRNLADYPLGPGVSAQQRADIEAKVTAGLNTMNGDLAGKYYSLSTMSKED